MGKRKIQVSVDVFTWRLSSAIKSLSLVVIQEYYYHAPNLHTRTSSYVMVWSSQRTGHRQRSQ